MAKTQVTFEKYFIENGTSGDRDWTRTDFVTTDGVRFKTFDGAIASQGKNLKGQLVEVEYQPKERGQWVDNMITSLTALSGTAPTEAKADPAPRRELPATGQPVDRAGGLARAIEFVGVSGESILEAYDNLSLFALADVFAEYAHTGNKPGAAQPSSAAAGAEGGS